MNRKRIRHIIKGMHTKKITPHEADHLLREEHGLTLGHAERVSMDHAERQRHTRHQKALSAFAIALILVLSLFAVTLSEEATPTARAITAPSTTDMNATPSPLFPDDDVIPEQATGEQGTRNP